MTNTPNLQWQGTPEAGDRVTSSSLVVSIRDVETDSELYYKEGIPRLARSFKVPANKLKPGRRYVWSVVSVEDADSNVQFTAPLRILTSSERSRIKQVERAAKSTQAANPKDSAPTLLLADAYEQLEMWAEAKGAYEAAQRLDPLLELETKLIELKKRLTVN